MSFYTVLKVAGAVAKIGENLKWTTIRKFSLPKSVEHTVEIVLVKISCVTVAWEWEG